MHRILSSNRHHGLFMMEKTYAVFTYISQNSYNNSQQQIEAAQLYGADSGVLVLFCPTDSLLFNAYLIHRHNLGTA